MGFRVLRGRSYLIAFTLAALMSGHAGAQSPTTVFYTVGHQDDWQLFMNPNAFHDVRIAQAKVVFIYLTAGDSNFGTGSAGPGREPYYRARERAAERATRFIATPPNAYAPRVTVSSRPLINGKRILRRAYGLSHDGITTNTVSYFFQLPDGFPAGFGPDGVSGPSLRLLEERGEPLTDILGWNTYESWDDLVLTLRQIVEMEAHGSTTVWANVPEPIATPGNSSEPDQDHSDHIQSGRAMIAAVKDYPCVNLALFLGYQSKHRDPNLNQLQTIWEAATFGATVSGRLERGGAYNTFNDTHISFLGRNYFRRLVGNGLPCGF